MSKQEYLDALKRAMTGLPPDTVAKTLAYYEQRFIDGLVAGRSEAEIAQELDEPRKIAMTLRANRHLHAYEQSRNPASLLRMLTSFAGLALFNLFMVIPAMVYASLLVAVYASAFAFYISGIAVTASGLSGQNELALEGPLRQLAILDRDGPDDPGMEARMAISKMGIHMFVEPPAADDNDQPRHGPRLLDRAEAVANGDLRVTTDFDPGARTTQTLVGLGMVLAGIALCLVSLVITRFTVAGLKRYVQMNVSLLRGR
ncbi:DUF1700 domain-containing protein [Rugamonas apoptosis]|uniref:DUF1700 domain-containing protein n=1 Tax=Rugamonas apoptosis TaxID=2758570 RepID=A0A7W2F9T5_9BURK|nr:DUF1700 domain-containing protein [Rugamonas apoptosis]MBA5687674.1 DUF1700 domain-containing protein [Rugamonas apoptosis]